MAINPSNRGESDRPIPFSDELSPQNMALLRRNIEQLWQRNLDPGDRVVNISSGRRVFASAGGSGGSTPSTDGRHLASIIDFPYDHYDLTWDSLKNVTTIVYKLGGAGGSVVTIVTIAYNASNQPTTISATHTPDIVTFTYDSDGYLDTMTRA